MSSDDNHELTPLMADGLRRRSPPATDNNAVLQTTVEYHPARFLREPKVAYRGQIKDGKRHGHGKEYREDGSLLYEGDYRDGKWHGVGKKFYENGTPLYKGDYKDGKVHGRGKKFYENGILIYEGDVKDGKWHGVGKKYREDGSLIYEGDFKDSKTHGRGKEYRRDGSLLYEGDFKDGKRHGRGKEYYESGSLHFDAQWAKGEKEGPGKEYHENGCVRYAGEYRNDYIPSYSFSERTLFYDNGSVERQGDSTWYPRKPGVWCASLGGRYVGDADDQGRPCGFGAVYYPDGSSYAGPFVDGAPHGRGSLKNGDLYKVGDFTHGKLADEYEVYNAAGVRLA